MCIRDRVCIKILDLYEENEYLLEGDILGESEKAFYKSCLLYTSRNADEIERFGSS